MTSVATTYCYGESRHTSLCGGIQAHKRARWNQLMDSEVLGRNVLRPVYKVRARADKLGRQLGLEFRVFRSGGRDDICGSGEFTRMWEVAPLGFLSFDTVSDPASVSATRIGRLWRVLLRKKCSNPRHAGPRWQTERGSRWYWWCLYPSRVQGPRVVVSPHR